jgi:hypothetical protein
MDITFVTSAKPVLTITPDGRFVVGEGATPDDAAKAIQDAWLGLVPRFTADDVDLLDAIATHGGQYTVGQVRSLASRIASLLPPARFGASTSVATPEGDYVKLD